ncbi:MAG TPA: hypothetical protein VF188_03955 [Longimicrobiales bacterium]
MPLDRLREAVAGGVEARSLRQVARDVGMSPTGLRKFLSGATPYSATRRKLERWYVREAARYGDDLGPGSASAALRILGHGLPPEERRRALNQMLDVLEAAHREAGRTPPPWLAELRRTAEQG